MMGQTDTKCGSVHCGKQVKLGWLCNNSHICDAAYKMWLPVKWIGGKYMTKILAC